jgi:uncharacterized membrane protein YhhN
VTVAFLIAAGMAAIGDWIAVEWQVWRAEYILKPLTLALLIVAACVADLGPVQPWIVAALAFGLIGDIALMRSDEAADRPDTSFLLGLAAFLIGHICYIAAFVRHGVHGLYSLAGALVVIGIAVLTLPPVLYGARRIGGTDLVVTVATYAAVLGGMATLAVGTGAIATAVGGLLFLLSDAVLAWDRFAAPSSLVLEGPYDSRIVTVPHAPLVVIATYHIGQLLILIGLIRTFQG